MGTVPGSGEVVLRRETLSPMAEGGEAEEEEGWAYLILPPELLEIVWAGIPWSRRALLSKALHVDWRTAQLAELARTEQPTVRLSRVLKRQVRLGHTYTFGVLLDLRAKAWNMRRPWRIGHEKYASFLWYLESLCAQADRHEMRSLVRHAIHRYEGAAGPPRKSSKSRGSRGHSGRHTWSSFGC